MLAVAIALTVGCASGANAIANIAAARVPDLAQRFWPAHPVALTTKAKAKANDPEETSRLAREAIRSTALSSDAFQILGLAAATNTGDDNAQPLLEYASQLSRRSTAAQIWLLQQELFSGDVQSALTRFDGTMRVSAQSHSALFPLLASVIAVDSLVAPVSDIFASEPAWLLGFMRYAIRNGTALPNLARIVVAMPEESVARSPEMQAALLGAMIAQGRYWEGRDFLSAVAPAALGGPVRDSSFSSRGLYTPFDWDYVDQSGLRATPYDGAGGGLHYSAATGQGGVIARQLITLEPGIHRIIVSGRTTSSSADGGALWRIRCARSPASKLVELPMPYVEGENVQKAFTVPVGDCAAQWLELIIQAAFSPGGVQGDVEMVRVHSFRQSDQNDGSNNDS